MALKLDHPLAAVGSIGLDAVTDHLDPRAVLDRLDPRPLVDKLDPLVGRLDPRAPRRAARRRGRTRRIVVAFAVVAIGAVAAGMLARRRGGGIPGRDTATGTDAIAKYDRAGYEDKSLGQAVNADMDLVDDLVQQEHGDLARAEERFEDESAGAPALRRQASQGG